MDMNQGKMRLPCQEGYDDEGLWQRRICFEGERWLKLCWMTCCCVNQWLRGILVALAMAKEPWCGLLPCVGTWRCLAIFHHKVWTACWILLSFVPCVHFYQGVFNHHSYQFHENSLHPQPSTPANAARDRVVQCVDSLLCDPRYKWEYLRTTNQHFFVFCRVSKIGNVNTN